MFARGAFWIFVSPESSWRLLGRNEADCISWPEIALLRFSTTLRCRQPLQRGRKETHSGTLAPLMHPCAADKGVFSPPRLEHKVELTTFGESRAAVLPFGTVLLTALTARRSGRGRDCLLWEMGCDCRNAVQPSLRIHTIPGGRVDVTHRLQRVAPVVQSCPIGTSVYSLCVSKQSCCNMRLIIANGKASHLGMPTSKPCITTFSWPMSIVEELLASLAHSELDESSSHLQRDDTGDLGVQLLFNPLLFLFPYLPPPIIIH